MDWNAIAACTDISLGIWDLRFDHFIWSIFFGNYIICVFPGDKHVYTLPTFDFSRNNSMKISTPMTVQYSRFDGISLAINLHSEIWSFFLKHFFFFFGRVNTLKSGVFQTFFFLLRKRYCKHGETETNHVLWLCRIQTYG